MIETKMSELAELERLQTQILYRIAKLELLILPPSNNSPNKDLPTTTEARLSAVLVDSGVKDFSFKRVPSDYYDWSFEARRDILGAASIHHLCKSIVLVNTQAASNITDCSDRQNSKYYVVVVQYTARFMRLAPEEISHNLTGFEHNGVTCVGMKTDIPVILDEAIVKLNPDFFWLGGGEIDLKLGIRTSEFINFAKPFIVNCSGS
ncbi:unnamed protein product [Lactuca virosa]|uniref:YbaK/aminoacyl-tRNA synthetase-associated domain-containing protein n=1 Tax=Lactuca virosa TaxID=75947 RepID=A0AAU9PU62_9ASTR|nr:unnamed protein product [Lactuca virosa]